MKRIAQRVAFGMVMLAMIVLVPACERRKPARPTTIVVAKLVSTLTPTTTVPAPAAPSVSPTLTEPSPTLIVSPTAAEVPTLVPTPLAATPMLQPMPTLTTPTAVPTSATVQHVVRAGETLSMIARVYHTTPDAIRQENPTLTDPQHLSIGMVLTVTLGQQPAVRTHVMRAGETLASIARQYGVGLQRLVQANGITDPNNVPAGRLLVIP
jgi:LysM repeat protein